MKRVYNKFQMFPVMDFRNGRYQGQTKDHLPHGYGCFMDRNFLFCIGEWLAGELQGNAIIIFPSGTIFYGSVNFRKIQDLCFFQLAQDDVKLVTYLRHQNRQGNSQKTAGVLPLFNIILDIDSSGPQSRVLKEYEYSNRNEEANLSTIGRILNLDRNQAKRLSFCNNFIEYFRNTFYEPQNSIFQYLVSSPKGKKEYFLGIKGEGLGVKVQPTEQLGLNMKKTGKVYLVRGMGHFSKDNQLKEIGLKMIDNTMKGTIYEEGVFSVPKTVIKYEKGKRPVNCSGNFSNYIKRSLFYRDKILNVDYLYHVQSFTVGFNENLRKVETQKQAQVTIQNPKIYIQPQYRRPPKQQPLYQVKKTVYEPYDQNPYNPTLNKTVNPEYNINIATDNIYRSASKKRYMRPSQIDAYRNVQYVDPMYAKVDRDYDFVPLQKRESPRRYRPTSREQYPLPRDYPIRDAYNYQDQYTDKSPPRYSPTRYYRPYPESSYPDSLYPPRSTSPRRPQRYSPTYNHYDQPDLYRPEPYYDRRR